MSKKFSIAKRISMEDIDHFEDIEVDDDFVDKDMAQIIADNEFDPLYYDSETIAVALQLAGYGKLADLEAKLAERGKEIAIRNEKLNELKNELHKQNESLKRKKQQVEDVHKAVRQAKRESAKKGRQVCYANNEVVQYQKQIRQLKQQLVELKETKSQELADYLHTIIPKYIIQDKISFAVEQLEKVKEACKEIPQCDEYGDDWVLLSGLTEYIDNQIAELTHQHEEKGE